MGNAWIISGFYDAIRRGSRRAGETIIAHLSYGDAKRSLGHTLTVTLAGAYQNSGAIICAADPDSLDGFLLTIPAATTATWRGGRYAFSVMASDSSTPAVVREMEAGMIEIQPNPTIQTSEMIALVNIETALNTLAGDNQRTISLDGWTGQYFRYEELMQMKTYYREKVDAQLREMARQGGSYAIQHHAHEDYQLAYPYNVSVNQGQGSF